MSDFFSSARARPERPTHLRRCPPKRRAAGGGRKWKERLLVKQKKEKKLIELRRELLTTPGLGVSRGRCHWFGLEDSTHLARGRRQTLISILSVTGVVCTQNTLSLIHI